MRIKFILCGLSACKLPLIAVTQGLEVVKYRQSPDYMYMCNEYVEMVPITNSKHHKSNSAAKN